ncbi:uncharacterized protein N0V89_011315 [Didymosphaeria variabile]|uniref:Ankyrin n=1 Tax=Didymosphaeria variabile TaxID=1932322 RepID=A0A9W8X9T7_9PLEO|nr:uncharacterized protein N0V89_011315 [Didymosphaeria variabile]KAJ4345186.1 hypothetical protein N0V89_011315 [Didymosphaeria variabile]
MATLQAACFRGHKATVEFLLDRGADMYQKGDHGDALQAATTAGHVGVASYLLERGYVAIGALPGVARGDEETSQRPARGRRLQFQQPVDDEGPIKKYATSSTDNSSSEDGSQSDEGVEGETGVSQTLDIPQGHFQLAAYLGNLPILRQRLLQLVPGLGASVEVALCIKAAASSGQLNALKLLTLEGLKYIEFVQFDIVSILCMIIQSSQFEAFVFVLGWYFELSDVEQFDWYKVLNTAAGTTEPKFMVSLMKSIPDTSHLDALLAALPIAVQDEATGVATLLWNVLGQCPLSLVDLERPYAIQRVLFLQPYIDTSSDVGRKRAEHQLQTLIIISLEQSDRTLRHELLEIAVRAGFDAGFFFVVLMQACQRGLGSFIDTLAYLQKSLVVRQAHVHKLLSMAIFSGHTKIVRAIIEEVPEETSFDDLSLYISDSLVSAVSRGHHKIIKCLLSIDKYRSSILELGGGSLLGRMLAGAAEAGHLRLVRLCYEEGADINMHIPSVHPVTSSKEYARALLRGKQKRPVELDPQEALHYRDSQPSGLRIPARGFVEAVPEGATITPLQAALRGYNRLRKVAEGPRVPYRHLAGLINAEEQRNLIVSELLQQGADPNDHGSDSRLPLQLAATYAGDDVIQLLLEKDATVDGFEGGENASLIALAAARQDEVAFRVIARLATARSHISGGTRKR